MTENSLPFFTQASLLDTYIHSSEPRADKDVLELVLKILNTKPDLRLYFFQNNPHPAWLEVLWDNGFLINPPEPIKDKEYVSFPFWDAQQYLTVVAEHSPELAVQHIKNIQGADWYKGRAIWTLQNLPEEFVNSAMPTILHWLSKRDVSRIIAEDAYNFMAEIAAKKYSVALDLLEALTTPFPAENVKFVEDYPLNAEAVSLLSDSRWSYRSENIFEKLNKIDATKVASILEKQLILSLDIEAESKKETGDIYKSSMFWRSAIEDTGQDSHNQFKDVLLESLRDTIEFLVTTDKTAVETLIENYRDHDYKILQRVRFHILWNFPKEFQHQVKDELHKITNYDEISIHHEFLMLIRHGYPLLKPADQQIVIEIIREGPNEEVIENFARFLNKDASEEDQSNYIKGYRNRWIRDRLFMIKDFLAGEALETYNAIVAEEKDPEHPEFMSWFSGAYFVSDVSPLDEEQLSVMSPNQLYDFLSNWEPEPNQIGPKRYSYRGVGETVARLVTSEPFKYEKIFVSVGFLRPEFAYATFNFLAYLIKEDSPQILSDESLKRLWSLSFDLAESILNDENLSNDMTRLLEVNWRDVRKSIVNVIEAELKRFGQNKIKNDVDKNIDLVRIRNILLKLVQDSDPAPDDDRPEEGWFGHEDPISVSINSVRPNALLTLIQDYSLQIAQLNQEQGFYPETEGPGPDRLEPEIKDLLTEKLDRAKDDSWAVHSIFGRTLVTLYWLNKTWVEENIEKIFINNETEESIRYFIAAWDSYVIFNNPHYSGLFELLYPKYIKAIENHSKGYVIKTHLEPSRNLARHILGEYLFADYKLEESREDNLIIKFFNSVPSNTRGNAIWLLWRHFADNKHQIDKFWGRAKDLWQWRVECAVNSNYSSDFIEEMSWFPHLLKFAPETETIITLWDLLEAKLPYLSKINRFGMLWEEMEDFLLQQVKIHPLRTIQFYRLMYDSSRRPNWVRDEQRSKQILEIASENKVAREASLSLIDLIASTGDHRYKYIYDKYAK